jgi:adenosine/AMP kinase
MNTDVVKIDKPQDANVVLGHSHFIKTAEDLYEAMVNSVPGVRFGLAFCEASGPCLIRCEGNDDALKGLARKNALSIGVGHSFVIIMRDGFPVNVLRRIKEVAEVCSIYCATANPVEVIVAETGQGRGILGVIDGSPPKGVEKQQDIEARRGFLRKIGYKL